MSKIMIFDGAIIDHADRCSWLASYSRDMRKQMGLGQALESSLNWHCTMPLTRSPEQEAFDEACAKWDKAYGRIQRREIDDDTLGGAHTAPSRHAHLHAQHRTVQSHDLDPHHHYHRDRNQNSRNNHHAYNTDSHPTSQPAESLKPSRTMRVFCAWKGSS